MLDRLEVPIVQAPLAGGPSTPALAAAVSGAGGLGFLAAGYQAPDAVARDLAAARAATSGPVGVNVFAPSGRPADPGTVAAYVDDVRPEFAAAGVAPGEPRFDDDRFAEKVDLLVSDPVAVVSFTFGCPPAATIGALRAAGSAVWVTVTTAGEAREATAAGADALVVQGVEAGGHRGSFRDDGAGEIGLLALLQLVGEAVDLPLVAAGGIATGRAVAAVLAAGARAAQVGTAFMLCPEAATSAPHRAALGSGRPTGLTRAFTGRQARGIENRFQREHTAGAPRAYPELHHVTAPLRAHARAEGDAELVNLWAGQAHPLARAVPAAQLVRELAGGAATALAQARDRLR
jgi:nitronate monooxygenase